MPYLEYVIKESLRLLPPTPYSLRIAQREFELGGHRFLQCTVIEMIDLPDFVR